MEINKIDEVTKDTLTVYEVSYLLLPSLTEGQVSDKATSLREMLSSFGGAIITYEDPILIDLAYPMLKVVQTSRHKVHTSYFGWVKFEIGKDGIEKVKKALDSDLDTVRYLIIKTVRENTLLNGKMKFQKEEKVVKEEEVDDIAPEVLKEVASEELDKSIDEMVVV